VKGLDKVFDVVVIGAGQAGLTMGYYLKKSKRSFVLVDASKRVGDVWRNRYDSLVLFSPRAYSSLPGMALLGDPEGFPTKDEIADYLEHYCDVFSIPVCLNTSVNKLEQMDDIYKVSTTQGKIIAMNVVIATGPFHKPSIPKLPGTISNRLFQLHSSQYRNPLQLPAGSVLIIGGGNSGTQIAAELSIGRPVCLSTGHEIIFIPRRIFNRSIFWWLHVTGLYKVSNNSRLANLLKKNEPVIGLEVKSLIKSGKIKVKERVISLEGHEVEFMDGSKESVNSIIWATGFEYDYSWIHIPGVLDSQNKPIHQRGISQIKGIYFLGLPWLSRVGSAQINGIAYDAKYLNEHLIK
jgi:putative flavoprotein involved in K+ transport